MMARLLSVVIVVSLMALGCQSANEGNVGRLTTFKAPEHEAAWIRQGEPIEFEGELWYPTDNVEGLMDAEVNYIGVFRGVEFFVDRKDVRPYNRLYTKFGRNMFRYFLKRKP